MKQALGRRRSMMGGGGRFSRGGVSPHFTGGSDTYILILLLPLPLSPHCIHTSLCAVVSLDSD